MAWSDRDRQALGGIVGGLLGLPATGALALLPLKALGMTQGAGWSEAMLAPLVALVAVLFYAGLFLGAAGGRWTVAFWEAVEGLRFSSGASCNCNRCSSSPR